MVGLFSGFVLSGKKAKGKRAKTRDLFKHRGSKSTVSKLMETFPEGAVVQVNIDSSTHGGLPHRRYQGTTGTIVGKQGSAFRVKLLHGNQPRVLIVTSAHLKLLDMAVPAQLRQ